MTTVSLILYTQPPLSGSHSVDEKHKFSSRGAWFDLGWYGSPSLSSVLFNPIPLVGQPLRLKNGCLSCNCPFPKDVSDLKRQANHIQKMHEQLMTLEMLKAAVAGVFTRHTCSHRSAHTHLCISC